MVADRIKELRLSNNMTQADVAKKLNITRSSVNAWEMGISIPSTAYIIELSQLFKVSTDYLLGLSTNITLDISSLSEREIQLVYRLVQYFQELHSQK
ncbi:MAG: helix-turn-helix transcriptional regulator [bacterium]|nr:helix-turn-helix transcriptional regulator [bacterium]